MLPASSSDTSDPTRTAARRLVLAGRVQGLGVRPAIYRLATRLGLGGRVQNTARGVEIEVEGNARSVARFQVELPEALPRGSVLERLWDEDAEPSGAEQFTIVRESDDGPLAARVPSDMGVCADCLREIGDSRDRRFGYPFTSCTACGPRYTIIQRMPYERRDTTMAHFAFCPPCQQEYEQPGERRFHAQTNACSHCGPRVWANDEQERVIAAGDEAVRRVSAALRQGRILAVRGLGGYQLLVDATNDQAVRRLRERKRRRAKPLAVMVATLEDARNWALVDASEERSLTDRSNPIVLLTARRDRPLAASVHPGFDTLGLMLPTTPLHWLLVQGAGAPLVCTSGNREGEPLEYDVDSAQQGLAGVADLWLHHDRPILRPIDDSVVRVIGGRPVTIRLARGLAPYALDLPTSAPMLALGGYFSSAVAWSNGVQSVLGPHIGDLEGLAARQRYLDQCHDWQELYRCRPQHLIHDLHPEYYSSLWAMEQSLPRRTAQHHHAHIVTGMLEHGWLDRLVLGVAWDGTGLGTDGTIWGGEFLLARAGNFERFGHLRAFPLPGGEAAIHEPWRVALAVTAATAGPGEAVRTVGTALPEAATRRVLSILDRPKFSPPTTSAGRLFDAAASLILGLHAADFEGQPAMLLEACADRGAAGEYGFPMQGGAIPVLDWRPLVRELLRDRSAGVEPPTMAMRFHRALARGIVQVCRLRPALPVVLAGGVFQNRLLTELVLELMPPGDDRRWGLPGTIPPNDGGLAAGQLAVAAAWIKEQD